MEKKIVTEMGARTLDLEGTTWTAVNLDAPKRSVDNYFFVPWQCQHCIRPACAAVCPVSAIEKKPTGAVVIDENKCIGCRYCYQACPFKVPRFDFEKRITRKCHMCYKWLPAKPACVTVCPVFAKDFGRREILVERARARADEISGYVHGIKEAGGTDVLTILPAEPAKLLNFPVALRKGVMDPMDMLRISSWGFFGAATLVGTLYYLSQKAKEGEKDV
ncbi:4Fe-4S dicluster domain-containing protein [Candidatus Woesearchaeota archaeon]|nr:4Fe-4S dicluster domain-containing protein [Candidatus Woesearchaeota archaeon]